MTESPPSTEPSTSSESVVLRGSTVGQGFAAGRAVRSSQDLSTVPVTRIPSGAVEGELNRFHVALGQAKAELEQVRAGLGEDVDADQARVIDTHASLLADSVFLADVENLVLSEQLGLESAITKVVQDFDRIFQLVENPTLRERAVDLRDVALRVLRALSGESADGDGALRLEGRILVARELTLVDLIGKDGSRPVGVATEAGSLAGHAAQLARSLGIPTLVGVEGLLDTVEDGDALLLDASEGVLHVRPPAEVVAQFESAEVGDPGVRPEWAETPVRTLDGEGIQLACTGGSLSEVQRSRVLGMDGVGLYRTEVLFLLEREAPSIDSLREHYRSVLAECGGLPVSFRLLDLSSNLAPEWIGLPKEANPAMGQAGVRLLLKRGALLRRQLAAILQASAEHQGPVEVLVPFVADCGELRAVREALFEERYESRRRNVPHREDLPVGVVLETPAAVLGARDLAFESHSILVALDALQSYLLAADRENSELMPLFESLHPFTARATAQVLAAGEEAGVPVSFQGALLESERTVELLVGQGARRFCVPPSRAEELARCVRGLEVAEAVVEAERHQLQSTAPSQAPLPPDAR